MKNYKIKAFFLKKAIFISKSKEKQFYCSSL